MTGACTASALPIHSALFEYAKAVGRAYRRDEQTAVLHFQLAEKLLVEAQHKTEASRLHLAIPRNPRRRFSRIVVDNS